MVKCDKTKLLASATDQAKYPGSDFSTYTDKIVDGRLWFLSNSWPMLH